MRASLTNILWASPFQRGLQKDKNFWISIQNHEKVLKCSPNCSIQNWSQRRMFYQSMCTVTPILCRAICIERDLLERSSKPQLQYPFFLSVKKKTEERKQNSIPMVLNRLWKNTHWQRWCWIVHSRKKCIRPKEKRNPNSKKIPRDVQRQTQQMHAEKKGDPKKQSRVVEEEEEEEERTCLVLSHKYRSFQETTDSETASELSNCEWTFSWRTDDRL